MDDTEIRLREQITNLQSEVSVLRGVHCEEIRETEDGPKPDGRCGVCLKCARIDAVEVIRAAMEIQKSGSTEARIRFHAIAQRLGIHAQ